MPIVYSRDYEHVLKKSTRFAHYAFFSGFYFFVVYEGAYFLEHYRKEK